MPRKSSLTKKQKLVMECIETFISQKGYGPTVREICDKMGLSSPSTVHAHMRALENKGYIKRDVRKSRSITLGDAYHIQSEGAHSDTTNITQTYDESPSCYHQNMTDVALVGEVAAGIPLLAQENITDVYSLPADIVGESATFMLSVRGESMIECGIMDGDYVVVKQQPTANNGDIVVALIDNEATVKRFYRESDHIRLQPENALYDPIITNECTIAGKVVALLRTF